MGIAAHGDLTIYGGDATDAYACSPVPNDMFLAVDDVYAEWYKDKYGVTLNKRQVLPVQHALQGHPESRKMWMHMIDNILIKELGFRTTMHDRCIYLQEQNGSKQLLLRQIDDFCCGVSTKQEAREIFNGIRSKIQFPSEEEIGIIPFEFLGVVKDYNSVDIEQTPNYIKMNCSSYISRLLNTHGWGSSSQGEVSNKNVAVPTLTLKTVDGSVLKKMIIMHRFNPL